MTVRRLSSHAVAFLATVALASPALCDTITLANGNSLEGKVSRDGKVVVLETRHGSMRFPAAEVVSVTEGKTTWDQYLERRDALLNKLVLRQRAAKATTATEGTAETGDSARVAVDASSSDGANASASSGDAGLTADAETAPAAVAADLHVELGDWCKRHRLKSEARRHFAQAIEADPDHETAHKRLGHILYDGDWLTGDEYREARGFVKVDGKWVPRAQARRDAAGKDRRVALRKHQRAIRSAVSRMSSKKRAMRKRGRLELERYAESIEDPALAAFAGRVAGHYNAQWRAIKQQLQAKVLLQISATHAQLKRPIPTFTTSLGANSTPVSIQLPELQVARIQTTVLVPADIELDDE